MAAVANNPAFAKKVGISQSIGQEFMKADKRKAKKFDMGGPTSYAESGSAGGTNSFKDAFRAARKAGQDTFTWQGKKYTTEMAGSSKPSAPKVEVQKTETKVEMPASSGPRSGGRGSKPGKAVVGSGRYNDPTSSYGERVTAPLRALGDIFGRRREEGVMKNMGVDRAEAARRLARLDEVRESEGMKRGGNVKKMRSGGMPDLTGDGKVTRADVLKGRGVFKHGGGIKKYANGGSVSSRADGIAKKGKTRCKIV
jgi:hypothetical protein